MSHRRKEKEVCKHPKTKWDLRECARRGLLDVGQLKGAELGAVDTYAAGGPPPNGLLAQGRR